MNQVQADFWDKRASQYDKSVKKHGPFYDNTIAQSKAWLSDADTVLDFGCGSGEYSLDIASSVQHIHGIDLSGKMIELARQNAAVRSIDTAHFDSIEIFDASLKVRSFSAILALNVLHLVDDLSRVVARAKELLKKDGLLITRTPCLAERGILIRTLIGLAQKIGLVPPVLHLSLATLESNIQQEGFTIVDTQVWEQHTSTYWLVAKNLRV